MHRIFQHQQQQVMMCRQCIDTNVAAPNTDAVVFVAVEPVTTDAVAAQADAAIEEVASTTDDAIEEVASTTDDAAPVAKEAAEAISIPSGSP